MLVDLNARYPSRREVLVKQAFYGQLQNIFVVTLPACPTLQLEKPEVFILAGIQTCADVHLGNGMEMPYYKKLGSYEVVDMSCIQCLVGRVPLGQQQWAIIDRSGTIQRSIYVPENE
jgi:hypothetical protein